MKYRSPTSDINGLNELPDLTSLVRYYALSHHFGSLASGRLLNSAMVGINGPMRTGQVLFIPRDVVLD